MGFDEEPDVTTAVDTLPADAKPKKPSTAHLKAVRPPGARVMIEPFSFAEIGIAHAAG